MIARLEGVVLSKAANSLVLDVQGVGYAVTVSLNTFYELPPEGMRVALQIHTHVREDQLTLYGFLNEKEKYLFEKLITVNGVGPRLALTLLSGLSPAEIIEAVTQESVAVLKATPGIGQKVAQRIILDLKGKLESLGTPLKSKFSGGTFEEALSALTHLGYTAAQAEKALGGLEWSSPLTLQDAIKQGLKFLSQR